LFLRKGNSTNENTFIQEYVESPVVRRQPSAETYQEKGNQRLSIPISEYINSPENINSLRYSKTPNLTERVSEV
jgi:hypothetical protein